MTSNYPPGTWEGDPRAPWNAPDAPACPTCEAEMEWSDKGDSWLCSDCKVQVFDMDEEDIAYEKAQASQEWQERHGGGL